MFVAQVQCVRASVCVCMRARMCSVCDVCVLVCSVCVYENFARMVLQFYHQRYVKLGKDKHQIGHWYRPLCEFQYQIITLISYRCNTSVWLCSVCVCVSLI